MRLNTLRLPDGAGSTLVGLFGREILKLMTIENNINNNNNKKKGCQVSLWVPDCSTLLGASPSALSKGPPSPERPGSVQCPFPGPAPPSREQPCPGLACVWTRTPTHIYYVNGFSPAARRRTGARSIPPHPCAAQIFAVRMKNHLVSQSRSRHKRDLS